MKNFPLSIKKLHSRRIIFFRPQTEILTYSKNTWGFYYLSYNLKSQMGVQKFKIKRKKLLQVDRTATVGCNKVTRHVN